MSEIQPENQKAAQNPTAVSMPGPLSLFVASASIIFIAEALVMLLIYLLELPENFFIGVIDATLLSLVVVPTLYFMLFKPMRETIQQVNESKQLQQQSVEREQLKNELISMASHELASPVTNIMGYTEMLLEDIDPSRRKEFLDVIYRNATTLERLLDDLGVINRPDSARGMKIHQTENNLVATVQDVGEVYRSRFPEVPISLSLPENSLSLCYDEVRIRQVLDNVFSNAVRYSQDQCSQIEVIVDSQGEKAVIQVRDNGIGMTPEELSQVYDKFYRAETKKDDFEGLGLGLAIVKDIVEGHNGTIAIESEKQIGTTVTIALPK